MPLKAMTLPPDIDLNDWQKTACRSYGGGDYRHFADSGEMSEIELENCGDTLLTYLIRDLSSEEDCADKSTAIARVKAAIASLDSVLKALEELSDNAL